MRLHCEYYELFQSHSGYLNRTHDFHVLEHLAYLSAGDHDSPVFWDPNSDDFRPQRSTRASLLVMIHDVLFIGGRGREKREASSCIVRVCAVKMKTKEVTVPCKKA